MRFVKLGLDVVFLYPGSVPTPALEGPKGFGFMELDRSSVSQYFGSRQVDEWRLKAYSQLLDQNCKGFLLYRGEEWASVQWIAVPGSVNPPHLPASVSKGRYWAFNEHTREECRRQGLWRLLKAHTFSHMAKRYSDFEGNIFSDTSVTNVPARRAHMQFGFEAAGMVRRLSVTASVLGTASVGYWTKNAVHPPHRGDERMTK